jgi:hypothetical protein
MNITTVELTKSGEVFIVNQGLDNEIFVPDNMDNRHRVMVKEWIDEGNTPDPYVEPEIPYQDKRIQAYGSIGDQLDMQYRDLVNDTTEWKDHIAKVKSDIPKE